MIYVMVCFAMLFCGFGYLVVLLCFAKLYNATKDEVVKQTVQYIVM